MKNENHVCDKNKLQEYYRKPDGDYTLIYRRCLECLKIHVEKVINDI